MVKLRTTRVLFQGRQSRGKCCKKKEMQSIQYFATKGDATSNPQEAPLFLPFPGPEALETQVPVKLSPRRLYAASLAAMAATAAVRLRGRLRGSSFLYLEAEVLRGSSECSGVEPMPR